MTRLPSSRRVLLGALACLVTAGTASVATTDAAASTSAAGVAKLVRWTTTQSLCATPANPKAIRCYAQVAVDVPKGTAGATAVTAAAVGHGPAGGYSPADLAKAYGYNPKAAVDQTVAIVDWYDDPYALADLNVFNRRYGLPQETAASFRKVNQRGAAKPLPKASRSLAGEISLDVQAVRGVCNHCKIVLVEADNPSNNDLAAAENTAVRLGADEVSNSWGGSEYGENATLAKAFQHPGVVITASTGDSGWYGWESSYDDVNNDSDNAPSFPSTSPYVVSVGGTRLAVNTNGTRKAEAVWNGNRGAYSSGNGGAAGSGCSLRYTAPAWQSREAGYKLTDCRSKRLASDISVLADPNYGYDVFNRFAEPAYNPRCSTTKPNNYCWQRTGGTSLSSPVVAALYALAGGSGGSAYPSASLYVNSDRTATARYDVTVGGNGFCGGDDTTTCSQAAETFSGYATNNPNGIVVNSDNQVYGDLWDCSYRSDGANQTPGFRSNAECTAGPGLDGPTGLGTPNGLRLFADTSPNATFALPSGVRHGKARTYTAGLRVTPGSRVAAVSWKWGDGVATTGKAATSTKAVHTYARAGRYTLTFAARDTLGQTIYRTRTIVVS